MAGAFIPFGGATSSTAAHAVENVGVARALAGCIFPVGLMLIVFLGGELFTGNCLIIMDVFDKRVTWGGLFRDLFIVFFSNLVGALCVDLLIVYSGNLNYSGGLLGAYTIKVAVGKIAISPLQGITSGILCNILVCLAVLMATSARDIAGKVWAIFFPICAFVVGGFEHCVANMATFVTAALLVPGGISLTAALKSMVIVTIGNAIGGGVLLAWPLRMMSADK